MSNYYHSFLFSLDSSLILHICYFQKYRGCHINWFLHWRSWFLAHGIPSSPLKSPQHALVLLPLASKNHFLCCHLLSFQIQISRGLYLADLLCLQKLYQDIPIWINRKRTTVRNYTSAGTGIKATLGLSQLILTSDLLCSHDTSAVQVRAKMNSLFLINFSQICHL